MIDTRGPAGGGRLARPSRRRSGVVRSVASASVPAGFELSISLTVKGQTMATDADTIANADLLWELVHRVQETIHKDGSPHLVDMTEALKGIRDLADEIDPENGRY